MTIEQRHRLGCVVLAVGALGLSAASFAIASPSPGLHTKVGRHILVGALANVALSLLLAVVAAIPLRQGHRWAFWAYLIPFLVYGVPMLVIDAVHVSPERLVVTLAPQVVGILLSAVGLALVASGVFSHSRTRP